MYNFADNSLLFRKISLNDALCGCQFVVKHLDGRELVVTSRPGDILEPGNEFLVL